MEATASAPASAPGTATELRPPRTILLDLAVAILGATLVMFLVMTMNVRQQEAAVVRECQDRLSALAQAQQSYLVKHGRFADDLRMLRPFLEGEYAFMEYKCPITGNDLEVAVQGERYILLAPGTGFSVLTGDPNW